MKKDADYIINFLAAKYVDDVKITRRFLKELKPDSIGYRVVETIIREREIRKLAKKYNRETASTLTKL